MRKFRPAYLLLLLPTLYTIAEGIFFLKPTGYYRVNGIVGVIPIVLAFVGAAVVFKGPGKDEIGVNRYNPLSGTILLLAAAARVLSLLSEKNLLIQLLTQTIYSKVIAYVLIAFSFLATVCFVVFAVCHFKKQHISAGIIVIPGAISIMMDVVFSFVVDPVNSNCSFAQKRIISAAILAVFLVRLFYQYAAANEICVTRVNLRYAVAAAAYCLPSLISSAVFGGRILDLLPYLLYTFLTISCLNYKKYSELKNEQK